MSSVPDSVADLDRDNDPFRYGWRMVDVVGTDGVVRQEQRGLTPADLLHPEEGDVIVQTQHHHLLVLNLAVATGRLLERLAGVRYRVDHRIDWDHETIRPHAPDVLVFDNGTELNDGAGTIHLTRQGSIPLVAFEVTSEGTRHNDLVTKVEHYYEVGVPVYVIVDLGPNPERSLQLRLIGYQAGHTGYEELPLDAQGRLLVEPLGLVLAIEDDWLTCYDEDGNVLADRVEVAERLNQQAALIEQQQADLAARNNRIATLASDLEVTVEQRDQAERARLNELVARQAAEQIALTELHNAQQAEQARLQAEQARLQAEHARLQAEHARQKAEAERNTLAERLRQAEQEQQTQLTQMQAELDRLRAELTRARGSGDAGGSPA